MNHALVLVMIADDLTGSFDTGVQFEKRGASVGFTTLENLNDFAADVQVVVIDTESRHDKADVAYEKTARAARWARANGAQYLYVKTDSGLRGNVGPSIKAALDALDCRFAAFAPAYPDLKRITVNGCQLIDGVPVHQSVFGCDPFEPVTAATVRELIEPQGVAVCSLCPGEQIPTWDQATVGVFDAQSNEDLSKIARSLCQADALHITAGCAAFAAALYDSFKLPEKSADRTGAVPLLVVCGSVNAITRRQILYGESIGYLRKVASPALITSDEWYGAPGETWKQELYQAMREGRHLLIDTGLEGSAEYTPLRAVIADRLGELMYQLLIRQGDRRCMPMIIGGDTLMGFLSGLDRPDVLLEGEAERGVVIFSVMLKGRRIRLMSKSGGFGEEKLLEQLCDTITGLA